LKSDHVVSAVNPDKMNEIALEPDRSLEFHRGIEKTAITRDGDHLSWTNQASGNGPWQSNTKRLLSVRHENLPGTEAVQMSGQPNVK